MPSNKKGDKDLNTPRKYLKNNIREYFYKNINKDHSKNKIDKSLNKNKKKKRSNYKPNKNKSDKDLLTGNNYQIKKNKKENDEVSGVDMDVNDEDKNVDSGYNKKMKDLNLSGIKKSKTPNLKKSHDNKNIKNNINYNNGISDLDNNKIIVEQNIKNIFKKNKKKNNNVNNNIYKMFQKDPSQKTKKGNKDKNNGAINNLIPYLNYLQLNKNGDIDKKKWSKDYKNNILYNNIIKPYKSSITLLNNKDKKRRPKIKHKGYDNINYDVYDINGKKYVFDLPNSEKNRKAKLNNSWNNENTMDLGEVYEIHRSKTAFIGACFACDLGFAVSVSGYSPMTFSPYDHVTKREACGILPKSVVFEQYTRHKKSKFYKL